ncbi:MAG: tetratricopeptide repeat protein [Actinomycetales bacterium]|nr:tetratricopeptide repeat protein [Actinomycetales bacterium]
MTSGTLLTTAAAPEDAEIVRDAQGRQFHQIHSSVEGIKVRGLNEGIPVDSIYERAMGNSDRDAVSVRPFRSPWEDEDGNRIKPDEQLQGRVSGGIGNGNSYDSIVRRVEANYKGRADVNVDSSGELSLRDRRKQVEARISRPRIGTLEDARPSDSSGSFEGFSRPEGDPEAGIGPDFRRSTVGLPLDESEEGEPSSTSDASGRASDSSDAESESARNLRSPEELYDIYQHRTVVDGVGDEQLSDRAMELVDQAGGYMAKGRYARATDRLKDALRYAPGNPLIEAALANAQIGFGAFFSAELTLARLFRNHFEVAGAVFDGDDLIPNRTNLLLNAADLRDLITARKREGSRASGGLGLVLAYIGWQVDDRMMIREGLDTMKGSRREGLVEGLEVVWLANPVIEGDTPARGGQSESK